MKNVVRFSLFLVMAGMVFSGYGCASKKTTNKKIGALEAQVSALTEEVARLDQQLQESRGAAVASQGETSSYTGGGNVYRTPSGFELPSNNIQAALKNAGYYQGSIDGKIGRATKEALKSFQKDNGLEADGVCGRRTWDKLKPYLAGAK